MTDPVLSLSQFVNFSLINKVEPSSVQLPLAFNEWLESRSFTFKTDVTVTNLEVFTTFYPSKRIHTCQVERGVDLSPRREAELLHKNGTGRKERLG